MTWRFYLEPLPKLVVVGSNPIARSKLVQPQKEFEARQGIPRGVSPIRGERARGLAPSAGAGEPSPHYHLFLGFSVREMFGIRGSLSPGDSRTTIGKDQP